MGKQWDADIAVSESLAQRVLAQQFHEFALADVRTLDFGWDNAVFLVDETNVFRFPGRQVAVELLEMENRVLPWLAAQLPTQIPNPQFVGRATSEYPFPFSGYRRISGTVPHRLRLDDVARAAVATPLGTFLRTLHGASVSHAIDRGMAASDSIGRMDLRKRLPMFLAKIDEAAAKRLIDNPLQLRHEAEKLQSAGLDASGHRAVVHGDLNFRNILVHSNGGLAGVLDWGDAHIGHPAVDIAFAYGYLPPTARAVFFEAYGPVSPEMRQLARFRALYMSLLILLYAHDIQDADQLAEARRELCNVMME